MHKQQGWPQAWEYCQAKPIQTLGRASQGVNWSWTQCIKSHHVQTSSGKELPSHFWNRNIVRSILPGLREKELDCCSVSKVLFSDESTFCISFVNQGPRVWGREESTESMLLEVQCEVSTVSDDLGCRVICWCWSTVFSEVHSQRIHLPGHFKHFMLASADKLHGDADFIFQQDLAPAHTAKGTKSQFNDHVVTVLDWPANAWPEPQRESRWETLDPTMQMTWRLLSKYPGLHYTGAVPRADCLHATLHWCSNSCKRSPNQVLSA